jgi:hypothetical protein
VGHASVMRSIAIHPEPTTLPLPGSRTRLAWRRRPDYCRRPPSPLHAIIDDPMLNTVSGVGDNFQLHTLLADRLIGDPTRGLLVGQRPAPTWVPGNRGRDRPGVWVGATFSNGSPSVEALAESPKARAVMICGVTITDSLPQAVGPTALLLASPP